MSLEVIGLTHNLEKYLGLVVFHVMGALGLDVAMETRRDNLVLVYVNLRESVYPV